MVVIRLGKRTEHVQSLVVVERKLDEGLAPIHPLLPEEKTAASIQTRECNNQKCPGKLFINHPINRPFPTYL